MAAIAAIVLTSRVNSAAPAGGTGYELDCIAAFVVGGNSMVGGSGGIGKTVIGVIVIGVLGNALNILGVTAYPQLIVKGSIILLAVMLDFMNKNIQLNELVKL
jgi:ribose/xylose/arabinose/galactoside ABC-type transport system permease subunit